MMNTEVLLLLSCLVAIPICNSIPINITDVSQNGTGLGVQPTSRHPFAHSKSSASSTVVAATVQGGSDRFVSTHCNDNVTDCGTENKTKIGTNVTINDAETNDQTVQTAINSTTNNQNRAAGLCSNLNPGQGLLCRHAVIAGSKLDQIYNLVNNLIKERLFPLNLQPTSQEVNGDCTMNVSRLNSDLRTAVTAVCLLANVTESTESIRGCCHSDSHVREEFQQFTNFLQTNVFRFLITDHNMDAVEPICLGRGVNVIWLVRHITHTLQNVKQLIIGIESRQCFVH